MSAFAIFDMTADVAQAAKVFAAAGAWNQQKAA